MIFSLSRNPTGLASLKPLSWQKKLPVLRSIRRWRWTLIAVFCSKLLSLYREEVRELLELTVGSMPCLLALIVVRNSSPP